MSRKKKNGKWQKLSMIYLEKPKKLPTIFFKLWDIPLTSVYFLSSILFYVLLITAVFRFKQVLFFLLESRVYDASKISCSEFERWHLAEIENLLYLVFFHDILGRFFGIIFFQLATWQKNCLGPIRTLISSRTTWKRLVTKTNVNFFLLIWKKGKR